MSGKLTKWNRRYRAYATAHGMEPEEMLRHDREQWPGGCMAGYFIWINKAWEDFTRLNGFRSREEVFLGLDDPHRKFDTWLIKVVDAERALLRRAPIANENQEGREGQ